MNGAGSRVVFREPAPYGRTLRAHAQGAVRG